MEEHKKHGVTIIETEVLNRLLIRIDKMEAAIRSLAVDGRPWMTLKETCEYMRKGTTWVDIHKGEIGFTKAGGEIRFKRIDVDAYLEHRYYKRK